MFISLILAASLQLTPQAELAKEAAYSMGRCYPYLTTEAKLGFFAEVKAQPVASFGELLETAYYKGIQDSRKHLPTEQECAKVLAQIQDEINNANR